MFFAQSENLSEKTIHAKLEIKSVVFRTEFNLSSNNLSKYSNQVIDKT